MASSVRGAHFRPRPPDFKIASKAGGSDSLRLTSSQALGTEHKCGITDTLDFYWRPTASTAERRGLCQRLIHARFPAPLPTHWGPVGIANGREQEPAEEGDPSAGSCVCDGRSKIVVNVKL